MDLTLLMEYGWVLLVLVVLEGILAGDNALVMAMMVKHLPEDERKKALFYGLAGAFILRFATLFLISFLVNVWQVQAIGAVYLLYISMHHLLKKFVFKKQDEHKKGKKESGFWGTVFKIELTDLAFAVDSILAAVALAVSLPPTNFLTIGGMDSGHFIVVLLGGMIGIVIIRFAATYFVELLKNRPHLDTAAYMIVAWVGVKLSLYTLAHPQINMVSNHFMESTAWQVIFWVVLGGIGLGGWVLSKEGKNQAEIDNC